MNDQFFDSEIKAAKQELSAFRQIMQQPKRRVASNMQYVHSGICPTFKKIYHSMGSSPEDIRRSVADSICKQARRLNIDTNDMVAEQIVSAVKSAKVGF